VFRKRGADGPGGTCNGNAGSLARIAIFSFRGGLGPGSRCEPAPVESSGFHGDGGGASDIVALAQGSDGTLWIGGRTGLARFDCLRFVP
jgi:hypothetical protein